MLEPLPAFFEVCRVPQGGGLFTRSSYSQAEESTVTFENCTGASVASGALWATTCGGVENPRYSAQQALQGRASNLVGMSGRQDVVT